MSEKKTFVSFVRVVILCAKCQKVILLQTQLYEPNGDNYACGFFIVVMQLPFQVVKVISDNGMIFQKEILGKAFAKDDLNELA